MVNEGQVTLLWQRLFDVQQITPELLQRGDELIDQLRPESPLRFRLQRELNEMRQLQQRQTAGSQTRKRKATRR